MRADSRLFIRVGEPPTAPPALSPCTSTALMEFGLCRTSSVILGMTHLPPHLRAGEFRDLLCPPPSPQWEQRTCRSHQMSLPANGCQGSQCPHPSPYWRQEPPFPPKLLLAGAKEKLDFVTKACVTLSAPVQGRWGAFRGDPQCPISRAMSTVQGPNSPIYLNTYVILSLCFVPLVFLSA